MTSYLVVGGVCAILGFVAGLLVGRKNPAVAATAATIATAAQSEAKKL